jgi:S-DNA-T family DNA segregation ATPase FtsK/SpoIIIE
MVGLASLLASPEYTDSPKPLLVALGRDITGKVQFANVAKMPHALIAGTTGSGKSVTIHAVVTSLLFRNSPDQLRFIMVDPKRVELTLYNEIPHLLTSVITDAKKAILSLKWAIKEMERRYDILQSEKVRDIGSYHDNVYKPAKDAFIKKGSPEDEKDNLPEAMPYIVIVMDELSDLMQAYPRELEACIVRLAQMSRAVGIHLILATQRPSVNVITGLIKANVPSRIALQVASQIDSRTILDQVGAEKLLGQGDMLFLSGELSKPVRLQSAFISEDELKNVVEYLKDQSSAQELDSINLDGEQKDGSGDAFFGSMVDDDADDDLYEDAKQAVLEAGKASTSYLQRKLRVGYSRAARLIDILEEKGVIGPGEGSKPREILMGKEDDGYGRDEEENRY